MWLDELDLTILVKHPERVALGFEDDPNGLSTIC